MCTTSFIFYLNHKTDLLGSRNKYSSRTSPPLPYLISVIIRFVDVVSSLGSRRMSRWCNALKERMNRPDYLDAAKAFQACPQEVVIVGMGPMGLRLGVELALMGNGAHVTLLEKRGMATTFDRHNILHLWSWMETDMHALGASHSVTGGSYMHIGTRDFQAVLLRVLLVLGVSLQFNSPARNTHFTGCTQRLNGDSCVYVYVCVLYVCVWVALITNRM